MNEIKEFLGKTLDTAIAEACKYYDASRDQLEIEIIEDAKSGVFGLVGARKAKIMAKRVEIPDILQSRKVEKVRAETRSETNKVFKPKADVRSENEPQVKQEKPSPKEEKSLKQDKPVQEDKPAKEDKIAQDSGARNQYSKSRKKSNESQTRPVVLSVQKTQKDSRDKSTVQPTDKIEANKKNTRNPNNKGKNLQPQVGEQQNALEDNLEHDIQEVGFPKVQLADLDQDKLAQTCRDILQRLVRPIAEETEVTVNIGYDRVQLHLESADSGLLIGREGQNLVAIQYLATRMISKAIEAQIKIQVDAGDYHSRQDVRLQEMAQHMAQKVRISGRSLSTKPLSAYQRRVIHLALQDAPDVQTRSSGEGALKRVVVMRRKDN